jgi:hypothetical protein
VIFAWSAGKSLRGDKARRIAAKCQAARAAARTCMAAARARALLNLSIIILGNFSPRDAAVAGRPRTGPGTAGAGRGCPTPLVPMLLKGGCGYEEP